jgi:thiosulfate/3-mercaptopyruvate sulfurtransferase
MPHKKFETLINIEEFLTIHGQTDVVVFDCRFYLDDVTRGRKEYMQSHVPGAIYLDVNEDLSSPVIKGVTGRHPLPHPEILLATFRAAGLQNNSQVIAYDQGNGGYASRAWWLLNWLGHDTVAVLNGGFKEWMNVKGELDNQWPLPKKGNFEANLRKDFTVERNDLESLQSFLVDSREYTRYSGEYEPIDPIAGHIPGAICIPYMENIDSTGKWKSLEELRDRFAELSRSDVEPVFYCGSGVTACHNILAFKIATGRDAKLYGGSWSEWINYLK